MVASLTAIWLSIYSTLGEGVRRIWLNYSNLWNGEECKKAFHNIFFSPRQNKNGNSQLIVTSDTEQFKRMRGGTPKKYVRIEGVMQRNPDFEVARRQETERRGPSGARLGSFANRMRVFQTPTPRPSSPSSVQDFESTDSAAIKRTISFRNDSSNSKLKLPVELNPGWVCDFTSLSDLTEEETENSWPSDEEVSLINSTFPQPTPPPPPPRVRRIAQSNTWSSDEEISLINPTFPQAPPATPPPTVRRIAQSNTWSSDEEDPMIMALSAQPRATQTTRSNSIRLRIAQLDRFPASWVRTTRSDSSLANTRRLSIAQLDRLPILDPVSVVPRTRQSKMGKKLWLNFSGSNQNGRFITSYFRQSGDEEMNQSNLLGGVRFNDILFYEDLLEEKDCIRVDISKLYVFHTSRGISRFYVHYRLTFSDGSTEEREGPTHFFLSEENSVLDVWLLGDNEFLRGVKVYQDEIVRGVTFLTNLRDIHCGGYGGQMYDAIEANPPSMRVVAFCGSGRDDHCERIGFYSMSFGWHFCGHFIMVRELFRRGRAIAPSEKSIKIQIRKQMLLGFFFRGAAVLRNPYFRETVEQLARLDDDTFGKNFGSCSDMLRADVRFRSLIESLFRRDDGIFRNIMSYIGG